MQSRALYVEPKDGKNVMAWQPRLLDQIRNRFRFRHYSIRTEQAYLGWIRRFILFHKKRHPREMGVAQGVLRDHFSQFSTRDKASMNHKGLKQ